MIRSRLALGATSGLLAGSTFLMGCESAEHALPTGSPEAEAPLLPPKPMPTPDAAHSESGRHDLNPENVGYEDLRIIIIEPLGDVATREIVNAPYVEGVFQRVGERLHKVTDGYIKEPENPPIESVDLQPRGIWEDKEGNAYPCYTDEDLSWAVDNAFPQDGNDHFNALVLNGDIITCRNGTRSNGSAVRLGDNPGIIVRAGSHDENTVAHEAGHALFDLGHATEVICKDEEDETRLAGQAGKSKLDIGTLTCDVARHDSGDANNYANSSTDMGSKPVSRFDMGEPYNFIEMNEINPDLAPIMEAEPVDADYILSLDDGGLRGLRFELPSGHPLREIDSNVDTLFVGVQDIGDDTEPRAEVHVIAGGAKSFNSYKLRHAYPYAPAFDGENGETVLYTDESLGVRISANLPDDAKGSDTSVLINVEPIPR